MDINEREWFLKIISEGFNDEGLKYSVFDCYEKAKEDEKTNCLIWGNALFALVYKPIISWFVVSNEELTEDINTYMAFLTFLRYCIYTYLASKVKFNYVGIYSEFIDVKELNDFLGNKGNVIRLYHATNHRFVMDFCKEMGIHLTPIEPSNYATKNLYEVSIN